MYTTEPTIEVFTITYNEEKIINFFIDHYMQFCSKITVMDNYSTDNTAEIVKSYNSEKIALKYYNSSNSLDDSIYINIKNNCWKDSTADYVIVVDCDEFIYHNNLKSFLNKTRQPVYRPIGFDMVSDNFPPLCGQLTDVITEGVFSSNYSKMCLFSPSKLAGINYELGCHNAQPIDKNNSRVTAFESPELKLLHYKNLSFDYRYSKHVEYNKRMSNFNSQTGSGIHYTYSKEQQYNEFVSIYNNRKKII